MMYPARYFFEWGPMGFFSIILSPIATTTAPTSTTAGTSGCGNSTAQLEEQRRFVAYTHPRTLGDVARGRGAYVASLGALMGCPPALAPLLAADLQRDLAEHGTEAYAQPDAMLGRVRARVAGHPLLSARCTASGLVAARAAPAATAIPARLAP